MAETKFYTPENDIIFHCLFGTKGQEETTKALLEGLLKREVQELDLDRNLNFIRTYFDDKLEIADVRATDKNKNQYILEMQNSKNAFLAKRFLSYGCKAYIAELKSADEYKKLKSVVVVVIMMEEFPEIEGIPKYHTKWNFREETNPEKIITDDLEIHIFEIPKYLKQKENGGEIEPWLEFIVNPKGKEVQEAMKKYKTLQDAVDELNRLNADKEVRELADLQMFARLDRNSFISEAREEGLEEGRTKGLEEGRAKGLAEGRAEGKAEGRAEGKAEGRAEGRAEGKKEGEQETKKNIAEKMLKLNIDIQIIMNTTGLTKEEIENLK